jgi:hypothetical protein
MGRPKKRNLEKDSEQVSPPNKMPDRDSETSEILAKLESLEERFKSIEQEVSEITR